MYRKSAVQCEQLFSSAKKMRLSLEANIVNIGLPLCLRSWLAYPSTFRWENACAGLFTVINWIFSNILVNRLNTCKNIKQCNRN